MHGKRSSMSTVATILARWHRNTSSKLATSSSLSFNLGRYTLACVNRKNMHLGMHTAKLRPIETLLTGNSFGVRRKRTFWSEGSFDRVGLFVCCVKDRCAQPSPICPSVRTYRSHPLLDHARTYTYDPYQDPVMRVYAWIVKLLCQKNIDWKPLFSHVSSLGSIPIAMKCLCTWY